MRVARNYSWTANALHGAGIAILYATLFAIHALWQLLPAPVVFALMLSTATGSAGISSGFMIDKFKMIHESELNNGEVDISILDGKESSSEYLKAERF